VLVELVLQQVVRRIIVISTSLPFPPQMEVIQFLAHSRQLVEVLEVAHISNTHQILVLVTREVREEERQDNQMEIQEEMAQEQPGKVIVEVTAPRITAAFQIQARPAVAVALPQ
jgi:hypothetical protein